MPKKYSNEEFRNLVFNKKEWVKDIIDIYNPKNEIIKIRCSNNHELEVNTKNILHNDKLKVCPICKEKNNERFCLFCNEKLLPGQEKFCSSSHSASFNNKNRKRRVNKLCLNCNKELPLNRQKFCSNQCQCDFNYNETIKKWKNSEIDFVSSQISHHIRRYLFEKYNNKCCKCGWSVKSEFTNNIPLQVHHKDGNFQHNEEDNLELLCPNCHALTENYGSLNNGKGRKSLKN